MTLAVLAWRRALAAFLIVCGVTSHARAQAPRNDVTERVAPSDRPGPLLTEYRRVRASDAATRDRYVARLLSAACWSCAWPATAQRVGGELTGRVKDADGHLLPHIVVMVEDDTCEKARSVDSVSCPRWTTTTGYVGTFFVAQLPAGRYHVSIPLGPGFIPFERTVVIRDGNEFLDITLELRGEEQIVVRTPTSSPAPDMHKTTSLIEAVFTRQDVERLPLTHGRTLQTFQSLVPGVVVTDSRGTLAQFTALGQRRFSNRVSIDGMSADLATDVRSLGVAEAGSGALPATDTTGSSQAVVSLDAIEEVQIRTTNASSEHARSSGAQTSIVTRSGGERASGTVLATFRPDAFAASTWFENAGEIPPRRSTLRSGGASLGGPMLAGRLRYFATWDQQRIDRSVLRATISVPSDAIRNAAPALLRPFLDAFPKPNGPAVDDDLAEYSGSFPAISNLWALSVRLDATLSDAHRAFVRVHRAESNGDQLTEPSQMPFLSHVRTETTSTTTATFGVVSRLSHKVINDIRGNVTRHASAVDAGPASQAGAKPLPLDVLGPARPDDTWAVVTLFPGPNGAVAGGRVLGNTREQIQLLETLTFVTERHEWRFGVEYARRGASGGAAPYRYNYTFSGVTPFLQGQARLLTADYAMPWHAVTQSWAAFAQDRLRVTPNLSLDVGVRFGAWSPPASGTAPSLVDFEALPSIALRQSEAAWRSANRVAPRVQGNYRVGAMQLRAGWSTVYDELTSPGLGAFSGGHPFVTTRVTPSPSFPMPSESLLGTPDKPLLPGDRSQYYAFARDLKPSHAQQWLIGLDRELGSMRRASLGYAGAVGRDLVYRHVDYRTSSVPLLQVNAYSNSARSNYHALLSEYVGPLARGLRLRAAYAWSHAIDTDSGEGPPFQLPPSQLRLAENEGSADFDRRHVLRVSLSFEVPSPSSRLPRFALVSLTQWQVDIVGNMQSGPPVSMDRVRGFAAGTYSVRPDRVLGTVLWQEDSASPTGRRLNPEAFRFPSELRQGTVGRNTIRSSALHQIDLSLSRTLELASCRFQFRVDAFNVLNLTNFGPPRADLDNAKFGLPNETYAEALGAGGLALGGLTPLQQLGGPRAVQISVRLTR